MSLLLDLIPTIVSFSERPAIFRRISKTWMKNIDIQVSNAILTLESKYQGEMKTMDSDTYSTTYTRMREAIREGDIDVLRPIVSWSGYLPIPWDLFAFDIGAKDQKELANSSKDLYNLFSPRWSKYGRAAYMFITRGLDIDSNLPISSLKPFVNCTNNNISSEDTVVDNINPGSDMTVISILGLLQYYPDRMKNMLESVKSTLRRIGIRRERKEEDLFSNDDIYSLNDAVSVYLNNYFSTSEPEENQELDTLVDDIELLDFENPLQIYHINVSNDVDVTYYPFPLVHLSIGNIIELDRPDILDVLYTDNIKMINDLIIDLTGRKELPKRIIEYIKHLNFNWDQIIPKINRSAAQNISSLPIPLNRMMAYGAYHNVLGPIEYAYRHMNPTMEQLQKLLSLAQKYKANIVIPWVQTRIKEYPSKGIYTV